jgi:hypothetical protein
VEQHLCPHCDAPLPPTATFCLSCDTAVADTQRGLSVAEPTVVRTGRPLVGIGVLVGVLLVVGTVGYGGYAFVHGRHAAARADALADTKRGVMILVAAEGGSARGCREADQVLSGDPGTLGRECRAIVGDDPGARLEDVTVDRPSLGSETGTVHLTATFVDHAGSRPFTHDFTVVKQLKQWRLSWTGGSIA